MKKLLNICVVVSALSTCHYQSVQASGVDYFDEEGMDFLSYVTEAVDDESEFRERQSAYERFQVVKDENPGDSIKTLAFWHSDRLAASDKEGLNIMERAEQLRQDIANAIVESNAYYHMAVGFRESYREALAQYTQASTNFNAVFHSVAFGSAEETSVETRLALAVGEAAEDFNYTPAPCIAALDEALDAYVDYTSQLALFPLPDQPNVAVSKNAPLSVPERFTLSVPEWFALFEATQAAQIAYPEYIDALTELKATVDAQNAAICQGSYMVEKLMLDDQTKKQITVTELLQRIVTAPVVATSLGSALTSIPGISDSLTRTLGGAIGYTYPFGKHLSGELLADIEAFIVKPISSDG